MILKFFVKLAAGSVVLFLLITVMSYFALSDGYGLHGVEDGLIRVGFPFLMFQRGGLAFRSQVSVSALIGDVIVAFLLTASIVFAFWFTAKVMDKSIGGSK